MSATIKNESKQPVVLVLDHAAFANKASGWQRSTASFASATEQGTRVVSEVRRSYPGSLTIFPGESIPNLHDAIAKCSQMPNLLAKKIVSVTYQTAEQAPEARKPAAGRPQAKAAQHPRATFPPSVPPPRRTDP